MTFVAQLLLVCHVQTRNPRPPAVFRRSRALSWSCGTPHSLHAHLSKRTMREQPRKDNNLSTAALRPLPGTQPMEHLTNGLLQNFSAHRNDFRIRCVTEKTWLQLGVILKSCSRSSPELCNVPVKTLSQPCLTFSERISTLKRRETPCRIPHNACWEAAQGVVRNSPSCSVVER